MMAADVAASASSDAQRQPTADDAFSFRSSVAAVDALASILALLTADNDDKQKAAACLLDTFLETPRAEQELALSLLLTNVKDEPLLAFVRLLGGRLGACSELVLFLLRGLRTCFRVATLERTSQLLVEEVLLNELAAERGPSWGALNLLESVLIGVQHSPQLFFTSVPYLLCALDTLGGSAGAKKKLAFLQRTVCCLLDLWRSNDAVVARLRQRVGEAAATFSQVGLRELQSKHRWLRGVGTLEAHAEQQQQQQQERGLATSTWVGGEWDTSCGLMVLHATANVEANNALGFVHLCQQPLLQGDRAAVLAVGQKGLLMCQNQRYYPGAVVDAHRGLYKFRCESGGGAHWVPAELVLRPDECPLDGDVVPTTQVLARGSYSSYYERGVVVAPQSLVEIADSKLLRNEGSLLVRFDSLRSEWIPRSRLFVGGPAGRNVQLTGVPSPRGFAASMNSFVYRPLNSPCVEMDGTLKPFNYSTRGTYSLSFEPRARVFSGRWNHGLYHAGHWIGVPYQPLLCFAAPDTRTAATAGQQQSAMLFRFDGVDTLVDVGGAHFFSLAGQQSFTFEASLMLAEVGPRKMVVLHKADEHGVYVSETGALCYWRRVLASSTSSAVVVETLVADADADDLLRPLQLYHVAVQYDGVHAWIVVNRKVVACNEMRPLEVPESPARLLLGGDAGGALLNGCLFGVKLWACVRPADRLTAVSPGLDDDGPLPAELLGYWPLLSLQPLIVDATVHGNHGYVPTAAHRGFANWTPAAGLHPVTLLHGLFHTQLPDWQLALTGGAALAADNAVQLPYTTGFVSGAAWCTRPLLLRPGFSLGVELQLQPRSGDAPAEAHCFCLQIADVPAYAPKPLAVPFSAALYCQFVVDAATYTVRVCRGGGGGGGGDFETVVEASGFRGGDSGTFDVSLEHTAVASTGAYSLLINQLRVLTFCYDGFRHAGPDAGCFRFGLASGDVVGMDAGHAVLRRRFGSLALLGWQFESDCLAAEAEASAQTLDLDAFTVQLLEFERALKAHNHEWKLARSKWCADVAAATTVRETGDLLRRLARGLSISDWRRDDRSRWNASCRNACTLTDLVEALLGLEHVLGSKSFNGDWYSDKLPFFTSSMNTVRLNDANREQTETAAALAQRTGRPLQLCRTALARNDYNADKATAWLDDAANLRGALAEQRRRHVAKSVAAQACWSQRIVGSSRSHNSNNSCDDGGGDDVQAWQGVWLTSRGVASFADRGAIDGKLATGSFSASGQLAGLLARSTEGQWRFVGAWTDNVYTLPQPCGFDFNGEGTSFSGWSNTDSLVNVWSGHRVDYSKAYAVGLVNTGNSCYQNSLIQALNTTTALRDEILSGRFVVSPASTAAWKLVERVQTVFSKLSLSQRGAVDPEIKSLLMAPYNGSRQHDSFEFGTYLLDTLMEQLRPTPLHGLIERVYGGTQINVKKCLTCSEISTRREDFTFLSVPFPSNYRPITSVQFVSGKYASIGAPPGYSRISVNLNEGRAGSPYIYLCVRRDRHEAPITDIKIVTVDDAAQLAAKVPAGWEAVDFDLNPDAKHHVYLLFRKSPTGSPITELAVTTDASVPDGFKKIDVDINCEAGGKYVYLCIKRTNSIKAIVPIVSKSLKGARRRLPAGFDLLEVNLNMHGPRHLYLATTSGGVVPPLTAVDYVHDAHFARPELLVTDANYADHYASLEFYVALDGDRYLRCSRGDGCPIKLLDVFRAPHPPPRHGYEIIDLMPEVVAPAVPAADADAEQRRAAEDALHTWAISGSFMMENTDHIRFSVPDEDNDWTTVVIFSGTFSRLSGKVTGFLFENEARHVFRGTWSNSQWKHPQPFCLTFDEHWSAFDGSATTGDLTESLNGLKMDASLSAAAAGTSHVSSSPPSPMMESLPRPGDAVVWLYTDMMILRVGEEPPPDYERLTWKPLLLHDAAPEAADGGHVYVRRILAEQADGVAVITDATIFYTEVEPLPDGYTAVTTTPHGHDATLRCGPGDGRRLTLCFKTETESAKVARGLYISFTWGDAMPACYSRLMKTADYNLDANLSTVEKDILDKRNEYVYLLVWRDARYVHPIAGEWETSFGKLTLSVDGKSRGRRVRAVYGTTGANLISGIYLQKSREIFATYRETGYANTASCSFRFADGQWRQLLGTYVYGDKKGSWNGWKDCFMQIGLQKDYLCQWRRGEEVFSVAGENNHIESLFSQAFCPEMMAGSNRVSCTRCNDLRDTERYTVIARPPAHLIVTLKRFAYDYRSGRMDKLLHKVEFGPTLSFPPCPAELVSAVFESPDDHALQLQNVYGLYAVVVHAGTKLDGGHYYTYARDPSSALLHQEDDVDNAPWCRYDDNHVTTTSWHTLKDHLWSSIDNSEYLLFYRRLDIPAAGHAHTSTPLSTLAQVVQNNADHLAQTSRRNASLHLLQEIEIDARLKLAFDGPFHLDPAAQLSADDLQAGPDQRPLSFVAASAPLPAQYADDAPVECSFCNRLMPRAQVASHLAPDAATCQFALAWVPPQQAEQSPDAQPQPTSDIDPPYTPIDTDSPYLDDDSFDLRDD